MGPQEKKNTDGSESEASRTEVKEDLEKLVRLMSANQMKTDVINKISEEIHTYKHNICYIIEQLQKPDEQGMQKYLQAAVGEAKVIKLTILELLQEHGKLYKEFEEVTNKVQVGVEK